MQWNLLEPYGPEGFGGLFAVADAPWLYFVHSYAAPIGPETLAVCEYGERLAAAVHRDGVWGVQFHPEKSGPVGLSLLAGFVKCCVPG
jgi:imidazole glycerol-phosphate synthase subunit HisH